MLSSLNAYGGLSAAELLKLFAANSSSSSTSSSSSSTSTSTSQSASAGVSVSSTNDPANSIKAILAQAQIGESQTATLGDGAVGIATVSSAYQAAIETSGEESSTSVSAETAYAVQIGNSSPVAVTGTSKSTQVTGQSEGTDWSISYGMTTTGKTDYFQLDLTLGNDSVAVGFAVDGLGQGTDLGPGYSFGQGDQDAALQIDVSTDSGANVGFAFNLSGITAAEGQEVDAAIKAATTGAPNETGYEPEGSHFQFNENLPGFTANVSD